MPLSRLISRPGHHNSKKGSTTPKAKTGQSTARRGLFGRLGNLKIGYRIYGGFALVLVALVFLAAESVFYAEHLDKQFSNYGDMAHDVQLVASLASSLAETQLKAREYMARASDKELSAYKAAETKTSKLVDAAKKAVQKPEHAKLVANIDQEMKDYKGSFSKIIWLVQRRHKIVEGTLAPIQLSIPKKLTEIREGSLRVGDHDSASYTRIAQEHLLRARLHFMQFLETNDQGSVARMRMELANFQRALSELDKILENVLRRQLLAEVSKELPDYREGFEQLVSTVEERNRIREQLLDKSAAAMMQNAAQIKELIEKDERALFEGVHASVQEAKMTAMVVAAIALAIGGLIAFLIGRGITRPVLGLRAAMERLAKGDNEVDVPGIGRGDEVGQMANTVLVFKENAIERARLMSESEQEQEARAIRSARMDELVKNFDNAIRTVMAGVMSAADTVNMTAQEMSATAEETNAQAAAVAAAAEEASSSSATVAGSTEELTCTIDEIGQKVMKSTEITERANAQADGTNSQVAELAEAANKIGSVVELISAIAEQTNLLALNATIEAARAGEAGKGFAVVASEVKELAGQTAKATTEIGGHIESIQSITGQAVTAIKEISETIGTINSTSTSIASAITQQQAATQEIARAVQQAASGTNEVSTNITSVSEASGTTSEAANKLTAAATELSEQSGSLRHEVETFLTEVRAA